MEEIINFKNICTLTNQADFQNIYPVVVKIKLRSTTKISVRLYWYRFYLTLTAIGSSGCVTLVNGLQGGTVVTILDILEPRRYDELFGSA
jgi:hypothetical protein